MRTALLSDIHGNLHALEACLDDARRRGIDRIIFLGDYVGYGADAEAVVQRIAVEVAGGAIAIRGNHDEAIEGDDRYMNETARHAIAHARATLSESGRRFLRELPYVHGERHATYAHASAAQPERYPYIDSPAAAAQCATAAGTPLSFCGHVHDQRLYFAARAERMTLFRPHPARPVPTPLHRRWVAIIGSVGQPRDRNPLAGYALWDDVRCNLLFLRVAYDHRAAAQRIREVGLPPSLAVRVEQGF